MDDDGDDKDDTKRRTRNLSEKKRRDQFNMLVNELSTMVSTNNRKMDKSTVLKSTISFLKNHNEITVRSRAHDVQEDWKPAFLSNEEFTYLVLEALEGFVLVFSATGRIYYVSESVTSLLGHNPADVVNRSIFDLTYDEDRPNLYNILQRNVATVDQTQSASKDKDMVRFEVHIRRGSLDFREQTTYELVSFNGHFRMNMEQMENGQDVNYQQDLESRVLFICTASIHTPQLIRDVSLLDSSRSEFTSRHSLEWKFLFLDHRAPPIIGYLPFEVLGTSGYDYYHFDDLEKVVTCHEALMQKGELTSCYYRFLTKGQQWIWLQTRFYITYHQWNSKPEFVVCTHRVVSYSDICKSTKEEGAEADSVSEGEVNQGMMKEPPLDEIALVNISPTYVSEASDAFGGSFQTLSQTDSRRAIKEAPSEDAAMAPMSPSYMSEASEAFNSYRTHSQPASIKTASANSLGGTAGALWPRATHPRHNAGSGDGSVSEESRTSVRPQVAQKGPQGLIAPQHGIGAQYLDPAPYVGAVSVPGVMPLPSLPVIVTQNQAQIQSEWPWQEQLQRKHEELQQMIVRQQEELRQVKEQLLLARLGILQPLINVPYMDPEELQPLPPPSGQPRPQITYEPAVRMSYPPQHPPHPPHPPGPHHHMPQ